MFLCRVEEHAGFWFAAFAGIFIVRTYEDVGQDEAVFLFKEFLESAVHRVDGFERHSPESDAALIGDDDRNVTAGGDGSERFYEFRLDMEVFPAFDVAGAGRPVDDPVAVEEDAFFPVLLH